MNPCEREYDFALILSGAAELTDAVMDALFEAGCDDATFSVQYGQVYAEFSRSAPSLKDAILTAIRDVRKAGLGVARVDECDLVNQADIARRIGRTRALVNMFVAGRRGPGGFPAPICHLSEGKPLWAWCGVSYWLLENDMIRPEQLLEAEVVGAVNAALEDAQRRGRNPQLVDEVTRAVASA